MAPTGVRIWLLAARPATLPAAVVPVLVGSAAGLHGLQQFHERVLLAIEPLVADVAANRVAWAIHLCGEIKNWPDVDEDFEFVVVAAPVPQNQPASVGAI